MARWIDADIIKNMELIPYKRKSGNIDVFIANLAIVNAKQVVDKIPTADVAPVVHSRWFPYSKQMLICDNCAHYWIAKGDQYDFKYCPNCGARMDGEVDA